MRDQDLDKLIAEAQRDVDRTLHGHLDDRYEALAAGELSEDDLAALQAVAETSGEAELALEAFSPLDTAFQAQVVEQAQRSLARAASKPVATPVPWWSRLRVAAMSPVWALVAAAMLVWVMQPTPVEMVPYSLEVRGMAATTRGAVDTPATELVVAPDGRLELLLSPTTATTAPSPVILRHADGRAVPFELRSEAGGTVSVRVEAADLGPQDPVDLVVQLGDDATGQSFDVRVTRTSAP